MLSKAAVSKLAKSAKESVEGGGGGCEGGGAGAVFDNEEDESLDPNTDKEASTLFLFSVTGGLTIAVGPPAGRLIDMLP
jgi:hypothetical protein